MIAMTLHRTAQFPGLSVRVIAGGAALIAAGALFGATRAEAAPAFKLIRSDETYADLKGRTAAGLEDWLHYIPLTGLGDSYLTLGGEARVRTESFDAPRFGLGSEQPDTYALARFLVSADLHLGPYLRVYGELGVHLVVNKKDPPAPYDRDGLDAQVAFIDYMPNDRWRVRVGRQEVAFNPTQRFVAVRESPNVRQSFDGVRVTRQTDGLRVDAFYLQPLILSPGSFDDRRNRQQQFYGAYVSRALTKAVTLDGYVFQLDRDNVTFGARRGDERRTSVGARLAGRRGAIDYEAEMMVQGGRFAGLDIRAWGGSAGGGYTLDAPWSPRLGFRVDAGSGDRDPDDGKLGTFNPLFPKGAYFNETNLISWSNLAAVQPSLGLSPSKGVSLEFSYFVRRRESGRDAIYVQPNVGLAPAGADTAKAVGNATQVDATWQVNRNLKVQLELVHQSAGGPIMALGGHSVDYGMLMAGWRF